MANPVNPNPKVAVAPEHYVRLKDLSNNLGKSLSAAIGELLKLAVEKRMLPHGIPGIEVSALEDCLLIKFDSAEYASFSYQGAESLAQTVREYMSLSGRRPKLANIDHNFLVQGRGGAVTITVPIAPREKAVTKIFTPDVAEEFADLLEGVVAQARASMAKAEQHV